MVKFKERFKQGKSQGKVETQGQGKINVRLRQSNHNHNYNLMAFDTIEINPVILYNHFFSYEIYLQKLNR